MSIYSVNILSVCLSVMLQKALLLMNVFILVSSSNLKIAAIPICVPVFLAKGVFVRKLDLMEWLKLVFPIYRID